MKISVERRFFLDIITFGSVGGTFSLTDAVQLTAGQDIIIQHRQVNPRHKVVKLRHALGVDRQNLKLFKLFLFQDFIRFFEAIMKLGEGV